MSEPTPALWPTAQQAILAGQSPAIPGPAPAAEGEHDLGDGWPTVETVDLMLSQLRRDRQTPYWGEPPHSDSLDGAEAWLLSLRDWLGGR